MMEEHAIGEIFVYEGRKLTTIECNGECINCFFNDELNHECKNNKITYCLSSERSDKKYVYFKIIPFKFGK